jgi:hypothetical protein
MNTTMQRTVLLLAVLHGTVQAQCTAGNENPAITPTAPAIQFDERDDGTLVHNPSRLQWQRCVLGQVWDGQTCTGTPQALSWSGALQAAETHVQDGWSDWRVPNRNELASLVESRCFLPALDAEVFPNGSGGAHWTASPQFDALDSAWTVDFDDGRLTPADAATLLPVRLVRAGWDDS